MTTTDQSELGSMRGKKGVATTVDVTACQTLKNEKHAQGGAELYTTQNPAACTDKTSGVPICKCVTTEEKVPTGPGSRDGALLRTPSNKKEYNLKTRASLSKQAGLPEPFENNDRSHLLPKNVRRGEAASVQQLPPPRQPAKKATTCKKFIDADSKQTGFYQRKDIQRESFGRQKKTTEETTPPYEGSYRIPHKVAAQRVLFPLDAPHTAMNNNLEQRPIGNGRSHSNNSLRHDSGHTTRCVAAADNNTLVNKLLNSKKHLQSEFPISMGNEQQGINSYGALSEPCESGDLQLNVKLPSPMLVSLLGAGGCRRRKRIKVVSCYILGPLLGEGVFGVVRDAIDTSANGVFPPCFQRVAIKSYKYRRSSAPMLVPTFDPVVGSCSAAASPLRVGNFTISEAQKREDLKMRRLLESEACNLQRFHCPNIIRSKDIFTRDGKDFVVLPIAVCNLDQLVKETVRYGFRHGQGVYSPNNSAPVSQQERRNSPLGKSFESDMTFDVACASHMSLDENEVNLLSSTMNETAAPLFSAEFIRSIMYQLLNGVAYLHNQGLAHNDLKPKNILIFANGELKISDLAGVFEEYNDHGTPMYVSPEICKYFYCAGDAEDDKKVVKVDALKNDMWSCGVILYYLLTGRPLWRPHSDTRNKYQLYREIASQESQINLDHVPEPRESTAMTTPPTTVEDPLVKTNMKPEHSTVEGVSPSSLRHLLSSLLNIDPAVRLSAKEAIEHPSIRALSLGGDSATHINNVAQREVVSCLLETPHLQVLIKRDWEEHLQFVAECCSMLNISLPREIFLPDSEEGDCENKSFENTDGGAAQPTTFPSPRGTVDRRLFPIAADYHYYQLNLGKPEHDLQFIFYSSVKVNMLRDYLFDKVLVECGYRSAEEAEAKLAQNLQHKQRKLVAAEKMALLQVTEAHSSQHPGNHRNIESDHCSKCLCGLM
ncbi:putative protein kinase [Trypanosoma rangeli]|uniref:Protein kinase domain-containing protein n=1 Tax=Trypanosoma rangeli TaxID=5698 RepID=A0A3R7KHF8_TRYRA|nr:putative protein kinase [Trypanosoma rangeli]RNF07739.1 putative protein kinase [Trypanosoma rangeli]|eukprot:RNF07739.1 putative protein kinase [Trypanosoma rangeli]